MLCAIVLKAENVVLPITCNSSVIHIPSIKHVLRTRVGSPYVIEGIKQLLVQRKENILGYEANGGVLLGTAFTQGGRQLSPLLTRDGLLPALCLLSEVNRAQIPLSAFASQYLTSYTASSSLKNFPQSIFEKYLQAGRDQTKLISTIQKQLFPHEELIHIDYTDGMRLLFENGAVIHLRYSGNSPELRCYTEAKSEKAALKLNNDCKTLLCNIKETEKI